MQNRVVATALLALASWAAVSGVQETLDTRALDEAIALGQSRFEQQRVRFHLPYRVAVAQPPVDYIDVVTPFRRVVLLAEERARAGERQLGHRQALEAIADRADLVDLLVELTFHPHHRLVGVPDYDLTLLSPSGRRLEPRLVHWTPRYGPRVDGLPPAAPALPARGEALPFTGATLVAGFDAGLVRGGGTFSVVVGEQGATVAQAEIEFGGIR